MTKQRSSLTEILKTVEISRSVCGKGMICWTIIIAWRIRPALAKSFAVGSTEHQEHFPRKGIWHHQSVILRNLTATGARNHLINRVDSDVAADHCGHRVRVRVVRLRLSSRNTS